MLNSVQKAAFELIQADARFLYTLTDIQRKAKNITSNYIMTVFSFDLTSVIALHTQLNCNSTGSGWRRLMIPEEL